MDHREPGREWTTERQGKRVTNHREISNQEEEQGEPRVRSALYSAGLRPSLHPVFGSTFFRGVSRSLLKGGVSSLRPPHAVHPPIGSELPRPFPSHQLRKIQVEEFRREKPHRLRWSFSSPRAVRPRSQTVSDAETVVAWSVEDGVRKRAYWRRWWWCCDGYCSVVGIVA